MNTVEKIILLFLLLGNIGLSAQEVRYEPIFINQKTQKIDTFVFFTIYDQNDNEIAWNKFSNIVELPDTGMYKMDLNLGDMIYDIHIDSYGYSSDTFNIPLYHLIFYVSTPPTWDYCCGKNFGEDLCNGLLVDYYYNGNIHLIGTFKNGQPIDTLQEYYENGTLKSIEYYSPNKYVQKKPYWVQYRWHKLFDKEGRCTFEYNNKTKEEKQYYPNGNLYKFSHYVRVNNFNLTDNYQEYYENGNLKIIEKKRSREEYHENGILAVKARLYKSNYFRGLNFKNDQTKRIKFKQYDLTGKYIQKGTIEPIDYFPSDIGTMSGNKKEKRRKNN